MVRNRYVRRLAFTVLIFVAIDPFVVPLVTALERRQYESSRTSRFENSDVFTLGPIVDYLRENPLGVSKRVVFLGNSIVWGYGVEERDAIPAQFQLLAPGVKVFNFGVNLMASDEAVVIAGQIAEAVDVMYLLPVRLGSESEVRARLPWASHDTPRPLVARTDEWLRQHALRHWRLYTYAYRLQSSLWGTSTRLFLYIYKGRIAQWLLGKRSALHDPARPNAADAEQLRRFEPPEAVASEEPPDLDHLKRQYPSLIRFCETVRRHGRRAFIVDFEDYRIEIDDRDRPALQALYRPHVRFIRLPRAPGSVTAFDRTHFTAEGAATCAAMLYRATAADAGLK